jgi:uncharacterized protein
MRNRSVRIVAVAAAAAAAMASCSGTGNATSTIPPSSVSATTAVTTPEATTTTALAAATFTTRPGTQQIAVLGANAGQSLTVLRSGSKVAEGIVDEQGSVLFRNLEAGGGYTVTSATQASEALTVADPADNPPSSFYAGQTKLPEGGFGYITTRDGTTLSANVVLPGPADQGPYPTVVEYSGYQPSDPDSASFAQIYTSLGFAYVGVNMRGTGCSGGSFRYFETVQSLDGYDAVETIAAQPWVLDNQVGLVGISYPGISQLFVAATQPPSLNSITPLSVLDDSYRATLYPGGILNTGFAVAWTKDRIDQGKPYGQAWSKKRADAGDTVCADNQKLRLQNPDLLAEITGNPYYSKDLGDSLAPITFVDKIKVPVFIAGAWQDEQTGGHFPAMLDKFTSSPHVYITLMNGLHTESLSPPVLGRYAEFLQLYVAKKVPDLAAVNAVVPVLGKAIYGVDQFPQFVNRFAGQTYAQALNAYETEPSVRILLEQGGNADYAPGTPEPATIAEFASWPIPTAKATTWMLDTGGTLASSTAGSGADSYVADPTAIPATFYSGSSNDIWKAGAPYDWMPLPDGTGLGFVTEPMTAATVVVGAGSLDLWITSSSAGTDIEATISEVRPDGEEIYVQSGWLRTSQRTLAANATELRPLHTNLEADSAPLPDGVPTEVRVELFPFAHPFRAGSRLRLTIDAPGGNRAVWEFKTDASGETVKVVHDADHPSRLVLPVVPDVAVAQQAPPACGSLRGEPCRPWVKAANGG